MNKAYIY